MKRKLLSLLLVSAMALSLTVSAFAAHITPSVSPEEIQAGETVDVILSINEEVSDIVSLQYDVYYDAELFDYNSAVRGASNDKTVVSKQKTDATGSKYYSVLFVDQSDEGDPQTFTVGPLYTLKFTAKEDITADAEGSFRVLEKALDTSDFTSLRDKDYEGILTVTVKKAETPVAEPAAQVVSASLTLEGDIGVNFFVIPNDLLRNDAKAYGQFTYKGKTGDKILLSGITPENDGSYCFTQFVAAKEMKEQITLQLFTGDNVPVTLTNAAGEAIEDNAALYSVAKYVNESAGNTRILADKMASFGAYAQEYFQFANKKTDEENASAVVEQEISKSVDELVSELAWFKTYKGGTDIGISSLNISLTLKALTTLNISFIPEEGHSLDDYRDSISVKAGDTPAAYKAEQSGNKCYIRIVNIPAKELDTEYTITIGNLTLKCSALSYAYNVLKLYQKTGDESMRSLCNLVSAMYEYNEAANSYFQ